MTRSILLIFVLLCFVSFADAAFDVYLKDGKSIRVSRITFRGKIVDLYPVGGSKQSVRPEQIDYEATGIQRPEAAVGVTLYGTSKATKTADTFRSSGIQESSQEELQILWGKTTRSAVAFKDYGTIRKNQPVRIVWNDVSNYKLLTKSEEGDISPILVASGDFFEYFKSEEETKAYEEKFGPYRVKQKDVPVAPPPLIPLVDEKKIAEQALPPEESLLDMALKYPIGLAIGIAFITFLLFVIIKKSR